jgi:hypothetical protein
MDIYPFVSEKVEIEELIEARLTPFNTLNKSIIIILMRSKTILEYIYFAVCLQVIIIIIIFQWEIDF